MPEPASIMVCGEALIDVVPVGAGDSFMAALLFGLWQGCPAATSVPC